MKLIKTAAYLLYAYYSGGRRPDQDPRFRVFATLSLLVFIHLLQILVVLQYYHVVPKKIAGGTVISISIAVCLVIIFWVLSRLIKKSELEQLEQDYAYSWDKVFTWNVWFVVYIILSCCLLGTLSFLAR